MELKLFTVSYDLYSRHQITTTDTSIICPRQSLPGAIDEIEIEKNT